ncbi:hypothetical protein C6990_10205 [Nitrosopumilus sp. b3]|uniref:DUF192 domain-containing protein n=1 Tax=Nitrosopumilus sp. b3 TaxID=2109909 RepID=UPI0015F41EC4|nr:DUF192 domain-containing protein [Nitrosopumilus sp. b3]KAF6246244.1 hypothetical protein C6990_10205 [Nitrosopumilus sp. b3]
MSKNRWVIVIASIVLGTLQIEIMYDCSLQERNFNILSCTEIVDIPSYIQDIATLSIDSDSTTIVIDVEIADDLQEQIIGLMFRSSLDWNDGMLFVYESEKKRSFWMKNTLIPLDLLFVDTNFRIIDIKENVQPCLSDPCPNYVSNIAAKYVLEVNAGFTNMNNIKVGDLVMWNPKT